MFTVVALPEKSQPRPSPVGFFAGIKAVTVVRTSVVTAADTNTRAFPLLLSEFFHISDFCS